MRSTHPRWLSSLRFLNSLVTYGVGLLLAQCRLRTSTAPALAIAPSIGTPFRRKLESSNQPPSLKLNVAVRVATTQTNGARRYGILLLEVPNPKSPVDKDRTPVCNRRIKRQSAWLASTNAVTHNMLTHNPSAWGNHLLSLRIKLANQPARSMTYHRQHSLIQDIGQPIIPLQVSGKDTVHFFQVTTSRRCGITR